eukprot:TRINITY_DN2228_c2_g3_i1.p1 TRINITY_DN2228_c2_g3~~TRINITY_DN2228_c2_g3_i1.p1  ORF type:complete len:276 (+),score=47.58 TRINITY_DN2228_c2_g3_i1:65-892(+)
MCRNDSMVIGDVEKQLLAKSMQQKEEPKKESKASPVARRVPPPSLDSKNKVELGGESWTEVPGWLKPALAALVMRCEEVEEESDDRNQIQEDFECVTVPSVAIEEYAGCLHSSFPRLMCWVRSLVLLNRFIEVTGTKLTQLTIHRLLLTAIVSTARHQGLMCEVDPSWGIERDDLCSMERTFVEHIKNDFSVTIVSCLEALLPFSDPPAETVMAAGLISAERTPISSSQRVANWVMNLPQEPSQSGPKKVGSSIKNTLSKLREKSLGKIFRAARN